MPAAIPFAVLGEALTVFLVLVAVVIVSLMVLVCGIWGAMFLRDNVGGLPIAGGLARAVMQNTVDLQVNLLYALEGKIVGSLYQAGSWLIRIHRVISSLWFAPRDQALAAVIADTNAVTRLAQSMWYNNLPQIYQLLAGDARNIDAVTQLAQFIWFHELPNIRLAEQQAVTNIDAVTRLAQHIWFNDLPAIRGIEAGLDQRLRALEGYIDVLRGISGFEQSALGRLAGIEAGVRSLGGVVQGIESQVTSTLPLSLAIGTSVIAIENLVRLSKDPCWCLTQGPLNDLPMRIAALEGIGN